MELESNPNFRSNPGSPVSQSLIQDLGGRIRAIYFELPFSHNINDLLEMAVLVSSTTQDEQMCYGLTREAPVLRGIGRHHQLVSGQIRNFDNRPNLDRTFAGAWNSSGNVDHLIEISGFDHEKATKLFARFRERTVGDETFVAAHLDAGRRRYGL